VDLRLGAPRLARLLAVGAVDEGLDRAAGETPTPSDAADDDRATALACQPSEGMGGRARQRCDLFRVEPRVRAVTVGDGVFAASFMVVNDALPGVARVIPLSSGGKGG
jgi:hypothetical protein